MEASNGESYYMATTKPSAALIAYERLARELRRWVLYFDRRYPPKQISSREMDEHYRQRAQHDTQIDPDALAAVREAGAPPEPDPALVQGAGRFMAGLRQVMIDRGMPDPWDDPDARRHAAVAEAHSTTKDSKSTKAGKSRVGLRPTENPDTDAPTSSTFSLEIEEVEPIETDSPRRCNYTIEGGSKRVSGVGRNNEGRDIGKPP